jgi:hypothetical protein
MSNQFDKFFQKVTSQLKLVYEGKYEATDEILKYTGDAQVDPRQAEMAEASLDGFLPNQVLTREQADKLSNRMRGLREIRQAVPLELLPKTY